MITETWTCHWFVMIDGKLVKNHNMSCWAGVSNCQRYTSQKELNKRGYTKENGYIALNAGDEIFICPIICDETKEYIPLIVEHINGITPCELVLMDNVQYIKYTLINGIDNNLILLNFIRVLWNNTGNGSYSVDFFKHLKESKYSDPLSRMMDANIKACKTLGMYPQGHSNTINSSKGKIKTKEDLFAYKGKSTQAFLN